MFAMTSKVRAWNYKAQYDCVRDSSPNGGLCRYFCETITETLKRRSLKNGVLTMKKEAFTNLSPAVAVRAVGSCSRGKFRSFSVLLLTAIMLLGTAPANAAELSATGSPYGYGNGYKNVLQGKDAFQRIFKVGVSTVPVYSTSFKGSVPTDPSMKFQAASRAKSGLSNVSKAADVAARSGSIGTVMADANSEAVAVQLAIWRIIEGTDIKPVGAINAPILQRAEELVENASAVNTPERAVAVDIKASHVKRSDGISITVVLYANGKPLAGEYVSVKAGSSTLRVLTNDSGVALAKFPGIKATTSVRASFNWTLPGGTVLVPASGSSVITAKNAKVVSVASTKVVIATGPVARPTPKATPSMTPTPSASPSVSATPEATPSPADDFDDPASDVIEITPDSLEEVKNDDGIPGWLAIASVGLLFFIALGIARLRLDDRR